MIMQKLSRVEMKNLLGGKNITCTVTAAPGYHTVGTFSCTGGTADQCQAAADRWCSGNNGCNGVDCPGAA